MRPRPPTAVSFASLATIALECPDPDPLAAFYHQLLGWPITGRHVDYTDISDGHVTIRFARATTSTSTSTSYRMQWTDACNSALTGPSSSPAATGGPY